MMFGAAPDQVNVSATEMPPLHAAVARHRITGEAKFRRPLPPKSRPVRTMNRPPSITQRPSRSGRAREQGAGNAFLH
jgi:hypothetical protein